MVTVNLYGRLGNQLFQLATAISLAKRNGLEYAIPQEITCPPGLPTDPVYFRHFPKPPIATTEHQKVFTIKEHPSQCYTPLFVPEDKSAMIVLDGYFQSEKYFADQREEVLKALEPAFTMTSTNPDEGKGWVSLHVRRGDYLAKPGCHPVLPFMYYVEALKYFRNRGFFKFVVFSDDIPWCKRHIQKDLFTDCQFLYSINQSPLEDLQSMKICENYIISNSSFSWWGAWLNKNPDKIVIAPKTWFGPELSHIDTKDLIPEKWIRI